jgi:hypothetical protein
MKPSSCESIAKEERPMKTSSLILAVAIALTCVSCARAPGDYMDAELRAKVEALKTAVAAEPTTAENFEDRLWLFWDWANAFALAGGTLPPYAPSIVGRLGTSITFDTEPPTDYLASLDDFVYELSLKDEHPPKRWPTRVGRPSSRSGSWAPNPWNPAES